MSQHGGRTTRNTSVPRTIRPRPSRSTCSDGQRPSAVFDARSGRPAGKKCVCTSQTRAPTVMASCSRAEWPTSTRGGAPSRRGDGHRVVGDADVAADVVGLERGQHLARRTGRSWPWRRRAACRRRTAWSARRRRRCAARSRAACSVTWSGVPHTCRSARKPLNFSRPCFSMFLRQAGVVLVALDVGEPIVGELVVLDGRAGVALEVDVAHPLRLGRVVGHADEHAQDRLRRLRRR